MTTKVIISGGWADLINVENSKFYTEILKGTKDNLKILLILFAKPESEWDTKSQCIINQFDRVKDGKILEFTITSHDSLQEQVRAADIVYIRGGDSAMLVAAMQKHPEFKSWLKGKIVAGESAGTYILSTYFYSKNMGSIGRGIDLLPIKSICHFEGKNEDKLDECPPNLEKVLLKDFEHQVYYLEL